jgi:hypothetical protein
MQEKCRTGTRKTKHLIRGCHPNLRVSKKNASSHYSGFRGVDAGQHVKGCNRREQRSVCPTLMAQALAGAFLRVWRQSVLSSCCASVVSQKFIYEVSPRSGRNNVAHGVSRGLTSLPSPPSPLPPARERGAEGGVRAFSPGLAPWATIFRPFGAAYCAHEPTCLVNEFLRHDISSFLKNGWRLAKGHGFSRAARELPNAFNASWRASLRRG